MKHYLYTVVSVLILVCSSRCPVAAEPLFAGMLEPSDVMTALRQVDTNAYPDAETVLVDSVLNIQYAADGTYEQWDEAYVKILTEKGRRQYQTLSSYFTIPYQRGPEDCRIEQVDIIKPDGTIIPVDVESQSRIMVNPGSMIMNIYNPNDKIIQVSIAGLEVGDTIHYVMFDRIVQPRVKEAWFDWQVFENTRPIRHAVLEVHAPRERLLQEIALKDAIGNTVSYTNRTVEDGMIYRWEAHDVPRMFPEPNMPPLHTVVQRLLVSTMPDWQSVSRWYWNLSLPHLQAVSPEMISTVEQLAGNLDTSREKIEALFQYVSKEIRYMGIIAESTAPGYEPHDVKDTFSARHGVCRDKAALLVAMLRQAGLDAFPALIHNGPKKDEEIPQPYFNHAIVAVRRSDGEYLLMDPTDENTTELLPAYLNDKSFLVATPEGETLLTSPIIPAEQNLMEIRTTGEIDRSGYLVAETVLHFNGINDNAYRGWFARQKPEDRDRFFEGAIKHAAAGARMTEISYYPEDMTDTSTTLTVRIAFEAEDVLIKGRGLAMLPLPLLGTRLGLVNFIIGHTGLDVRKYPLLTEMACGVQENVQFTLDAAFTNILSLPACEPVHTDPVSWNMQVAQTGSVLTASDTFKLNVVEFNPEQYQTLKSTLRQSEKDLRKMPIYKLAESADSATDSADTIILRDDISYVLTSPSEYTVNHAVRKKILTYAGKKNNAEIKLSYNTAWENVTLLYARVISPGGTTNHISDKEINIMDAAWVGSAPRYPPARIMVAGLPAVEVGSTIEYAYQRTCRNRPFFSTRSTFREVDPVQSRALSISYPLSVGLHDISTQPDALEYNRQSTGDMRKVTWRARNIAPVEREDMLPPWWTFNPAVFASSGSWSQYAHVVFSHLTNATADAGNARQRALKLTEGISDPWEKIRLVRDDVAINIRSAGPALPLLPFTAVTPADQTLQDGYGNTTDRAVLLYVMLEAVGFEPEFVLVSSLPMIPEFTEPVQQIADPRVFPRVLVCLRDQQLNMDAAQAVYLNDTDQYDVVGATPSEGRISLTLPRAAFEVVTPFHLDHALTQIKMSIKVNGQTRIQHTRKFWGNAYGATRKQYAEMTPEERRRHYQELVAQISQSAKAHGALKTDFEHYPGSVSFTVDIPQYAVSDDPYLYFELPATLAHLFRLRSFERINPLYLADHRNFKIDIEACYPVGFSPELWPQPIQNKRVNHTNVAVQYEIQCHEQKHLIRILGAVDISPGIIPPSDYSTLLNLDRDLSHQRQKTILLKN